MKKRMSQNLENCPMKTLESGKQRNMVRSFVRRLKEMPRFSKNTEASEVIIQIGVMIWKDGEPATRRVSSYL